MYQYVLPVRNNIKTQLQSGKSLTMTYHESVEIILKKFLTHSQNCLGVKIVNEKTTRIDLCIAITCSDELFRKI